MTAAPAIEAQVGAGLAGLAGLAGPAARARPAALAGERLLPVAPALEALLVGGGLRRGSVVAVPRASLALALAAAASADGCWAAAVARGRPSLGLVAAAELGIVLERFAVVSARAASGGPGGPTPAGWPWVVAALLDSVDVVLAWPPPAVRPGDARRLAARGRERGSVLMVLGAWPEAVDVRLTVTSTGWHGLGRGHGRLAGRRLEVTAEGRGAATRVRRAQVALPAPGDSPFSRAETHLHGGLAAREA